MNAGDNHENKPKRRAAPIAAGVFLLLLPCLLLFPVVFGGQAFLPADLLGDLFPWKATAASDAAAPWNVLRFDGITQFYGWRLLVAEAWRSGGIPLWNPYTFAAQGGTPLLANSQSAPLYPFNIFFILFPPSQIWRAFGVSVFFHLCVALGGMYRFLRGLPVSRASAVLGATVWGLSAPIVTWLALPTFLCVTCWLPLLLFLIKTAHEKAGTRMGRLAMFGAGGVGGLVLLAGHLQMAFYVLLAALLYALFLGLTTSAAEPGTQKTAFLLRWGVGLCAALGLAVALALPQLLPALELSRQSHRAAGGGPTASAYAAYVANALPPRNAVTLLVPDFFGHPNKNGGAYWNANNYAEWAVYVGVLPLVLALLALALPWKGTRNLPKERVFAAILMATALLLALGTPLNAAFFWGLPGYNQTGNPARCLVLWAFAAAMLAAIGADAAANAAFAAPVKNRAALIAFVTPVLLAAVGASLASRFAAEFLPRTSFGDLMALALPGVQIALVWLGLAAGALLALLRMPVKNAPVVCALCAVLCAADLLWFGFGYNPSSPPDTVFPVTPGIAYLQASGNNALIAPINRGWSLVNTPPSRAVLPPNTLAAYRLHDVAGYDSLFPGAYKTKAQEAGDGADASPPENGNMVFVKSAAAAVKQNARFLVYAPDARTEEADAMGLRRVYAGADMITYENPAGGSVAKTEPSAFAPPYPATAFRFGLWAGLCGLSAFCAVLFGVGFRQKARRR